MHKNSKGSVLAISLVLLTAITLIALQSMQRSGLQTKITANLQHQELLFQTSANAQEHWSKILRTPTSGDSLLLQPLSEFSLDVNNKQVYAPILLVDNNVTHNAGALIDHASTLEFLPSEAGNIALSVGGETGLETTYKFLISSNSTISQRNLNSRQDTGLSFTGLIANKHSL